MNRSVNHRRAARYLLGGAIYATAAVALLASFMNHSLWGK